ncbi:MAG: polyphosphate kinase 1 [Bryobacterales bacterium]|nr:polyphosphate kinase 1 [Bryobacterales bacterium]
MGSRASTSRSKRASTPSLDDPSLYVNRELSLLAFQWRVLEEAQDVSNPLLERVKFLSIVGSNLDEFFMVRVAGLQQQFKAGIIEASSDRMTPAQQLDAINADYQRLILAAHKCLTALLEELAHENIHLVDYAELNETQRAAADRYFSETIFPVLTPLAFDPGRPFPHISNLSLNLAVLIRDPGGDEHFARVKIPEMLPQLVQLEKPIRKNAGVFTFVWIEQVVRANLQQLFPGMEVLESHLFHVTRDAEMAIQELEAADLLESVEEGVQARRFGQVVRCLIQPDMPDRILEILRENLELDEYDLFRVEGPLGVSRLRRLLPVERPELKDAPFVPATPATLAEDDDLYASIRKGDILLHHPYDSFEPVVELLRTAAHDPAVLAIKMTLYRVGPNSPVVEALLDAADYGKQVAVLVELKARFDEESNIEWAKRLEDKGVHVVYGLVGLKIHAKVALIVRQEGEIIRRYLHLSTGNYNVVTAHLYTDLGLLTCDPDLGADATDLFNVLTGYSAKSDYRKLLVAPTNLRGRLEAMIRREIDHARNGREARIVFKINALIDHRIIRLLYEASQAGVQIDLLARGICCLRPGLAGISENIRVRSVVGRFLEHSRIFYFLNGGAEEVYLGSADLMPRNINRRVEVLFPVLKKPLVRYLKEKVFSVYLADNVKARIMQPDGKYRRAERHGERLVNAQETLLKSRSATLTRR